MKKMQLLNMQKKIKSIWIKIDKKRIKNKDIDKDKIRSKYMILNNYE